MTPLSEMSAAEIEVEMSVHDRLSREKNVLVKVVDDAHTAKLLERHRADLEAFANLVEAAWDNTLGRHTMAYLDALEAAEQREAEAAREAEQRGAA